MINLDQNAEQIVSADWVAAIQAFLILEFEQFDPFKVVTREARFQIGIGLQAVLIFLPIGGLFF